MSRCNTCWNLEWNPDWENAYHLQDTEQIEKSALEGCAPCAMLHEGALIASTRMAQEILKVSIYIPSHPSWSDEPISVDYSSADRRIRLQFYTHLNEPIVWPIGPARTIPMDPLSKDRFRLASQWLEDCVAAVGSHMQCKPWNSTPLPTRVLHVGSKNTDPVLHVSNGKHARYACLSYVWGQSLPMVTTRASLESHTKCLPFSTLPQTFKDAILVTRALGISYLWIDALCIIQDSPEDWAHEAERICGVFRNSYVSIAAEAATDSSSGFLIPGPETWTKSCPGKESDTDTVHIRLRPERAKTEISHNRKRGHRSKLSTRGWVLQERLLAPRTLFFATDDMAWGCMSQECCECTIASTSDAPFFDKLRAGSRHTWIELVTEFTTRDLTVSTDRLAAIAGLAAARDTLIDGTSYICGLWRSDLLRQLMWHHSIGYERPGRTSQRHSSYIAPTWSWASITGTVDYRGLTNSYSLQPREDFRVLDVDLCLASHNRYGAASKASLLVSGLVAQLKARNDTPFQSEPFTTGSKYAKLDIVPPARWRDAVMGAVEIYPDVHEPGLIGGQEEVFSELCPEFHDVDQLFWVVVSHQTFRHPRGVERYYSSHGLVLRRSEIEKGCYQRIGYGICHYLGSGEDQLLPTEPMRSDDATDIKQLRII
ncbi:uncharacterized protein PAC_12916 [Phialocephala subalpina]|uniref:Heterokaryon incompatibility domain-containing protein n=1 Tax=Phialocephala subalpina TaxID=576137 RepID=A0A1L7XD97_9HELO|nr:uncharacterized protein PAC_12916 [Phialocephala subalpina]